MTILPITEAIARSCLAHIAAKPPPFVRCLYREDEHRKKPVPVGTGTLLADAHHAYLLTAWHVFDPDQRLLGHGKALRVESGPGSSDVLDVTGVAAWPAKWKRELDVTLVRLDSSVASAVGFDNCLSFSEIDGANLTQVLPAMAISIGHPISRNSKYSASSQQIRKSRQSYVSSLSVGPFGRDKLDAALHLKLSMPFDAKGARDDQGKPIQQMPSQKGVSGAPVLRLLNPAAVAYMSRAPEWRLCGVLHTYEGTSLVGTWLTPLMPNFMDHFAAHDADSH